MVSFFQTAFYLGAHLIFKLILRPNIKGKDNIPSKPFIFAANHPTKIDPFLLANLDFKSYLRLLPLGFPTSEIYLKNIWPGWFIKFLGTYPVPLISWTIEQYMERTLAEIELGKTIVIFPEGMIVGKNGKGKGKPGFGYAWSKSQISIVPMKIVWRGWQVNIIFGKPKKLTKVAKSLDEYTALSNEVLDDIYSLK